MVHLFLIHRPDALLHLSCHHPIQIIASYPHFDHNFDHCFDQWLEAISCTSEDLRQSKLAAEPFIPPLIGQPPMQMIQHLFCIFSRLIPDQGLSLWIIGFCCRVRGFSYIGYMLAIHIQKITLASACVQKCDQSSNPFKPKGI